MGGAPATLALVADALGRTPEVRSRVLLLGSEADRGRAVQIGVRVAERVSVASQGVSRDASVMSVVGEALRAMPAVRQAVKFQASSVARAPALIHCHSLRSFALATIAWPGTPRVCTIVSKPTAAQIRLLRVLMQRGDRAALLPVTATLRRELLAGGLAESAVCLIRPGVDQSRAPLRRRDWLRQRWGLKAHQKVVGLIGDPPESACARAAAMVCGYAAEVQATYGREVILAVHPRQRNLHQALRILEEQERSDRLIQEPLMARPWEALPGCDAVLAFDDAVGGLAVVWAMTAGVSIVGEATYGISEMVEDRHSALLVKPGNLPQMAHRLTQLFGDDRLTWAIRDAARHEAFSYFSRRHYCQSLSTVYHQLADGQPLEPPVLEATGGMKFTGRA